MTTISDRIIQARKLKKWTQSDLAGALNVNVKNISRWELGQSKPSIEAAAELAKALNVSLDYLGGLEEISKTSPLELLFKEKLPTLTKEQENALKVVLGAFGE